MTLAAAAEPRESPIQGSGMRLKSAGSAPPLLIAEEVTKRFGERPIIRNFTLRIQRGDRIGVVGANGTGKTTLLKLLTGELAPDEGSVTLAKTLHGVMIDQQRSLLTGDKTVRDVLAEGGDWIDVRYMATLAPDLPA